MGFFDYAEPAVKSNPYPRQEKGRFGFGNGTGKGKKERGIQEGRMLNEAFNIDCMEYRR